MNDTLASLIDRLGRQRQNDDAILELGRPPLTFYRLARLVRSVAGALQAHGWDGTARVGVVMPGGASTATTTLAVMSHATAVPLNPEYTRSELIRLLDRMQVDALVIDADAGEAIAAAEELRLPVIAAQVTEEYAGQVVLDGGRGLPSASVERPAAPADSNRVALILHTSGSTAEPKIVPLTEANLLASTSNVARSLELTDADLCLSTMPLFHIGALVDLLLAPLSVGGRVVIASGMTAPAFFTHMEHFSPTWYQGVPTMLHALLRMARSEQIASPGRGLRFVRSVSAPLSVPMLDEFERLFRVPVIEIYGMTETAGVITSNPLPPGLRRPGSVGLPAGPEVAVVDAAGNPVRAGVRGEVVVRGSNVTAGYEDIDRTESFLGDWLRTGDEGYLDEDLYLYLTGRIKELINRGGEKISPREIDEVAASHPEILEAAAFAQPHDSLGEDVALAVVTGAKSSEHGRIERELVTLCREQLAEFKVPRRIVFLSELPRAPGGKLKRRELIAATTGAPVATKSMSGDWNERRRALAALWAEVLEIDEVGLDDDFFDLGGDSLSAAEFVEALRKHMGAELPPAALFDHPTIAELDQVLDPSGDVDDGHERHPPESAEVLEEVRGFLAAWMGRRLETDSLLVGWNTLGERAPLFFGVQGFGELSDFAEALGADQPVYGMRSLYEARTKSPENLLRLAQHYAEEIEGVRPSGSIDLGGYCAGGRLAHLVACELQDRGRTIRSLSLLEHAPERAWWGPIDLHFHVDSGFHSFSDSTRAWLDGLDGPVRLHPTHATHQAIISDPRTTRALAETLAGREVSAGRARRHDSAPCSIEVAVDAPRTPVSRTSITVSARVRNRGHTALPSGATVYLRWARPGSTRWVFDAEVALPHDLDVGAETVVELEARVPLAPGRWHLHLEVVTDGDWRRARIPSTNATTVYVLPGPAVLGYLARRLPGRSIWSRPPELTQPDHR